MNYTYKPLDYGVLVRGNVKIKTGSALVAGDAYGVFCEVLALGNLVTENNKPIKVGDFVLARIPPNSGFKMVGKPYEDWYLVVDYHNIILVVEGFEEVEKLEPQVSNLQLGNVRIEDNEQD